MIITAEQIREWEDMRERGSLDDHAYLARTAIPALLAERERLREALEPFADHGRAMEGCCATDQWCEALGPDGFHHWLAVQHFHDAARALNPEQP